MFTPERLLLARKRRGLTQLQLAELTGCSKSHVEKLEHGSTDASDELKLGLARALSIPVQFLEAIPPLEIPVACVSFRALTKMTARERDAALSAGTLAAAFSTWVDSQFELPEPALPDLSQLEPHDAATNLRASWQLAEAPISNMVHLLEAHGVRVFSLCEQTRSLDAFSFFQGDQPFCFLNTVKSAEKSRFDAAHELGHLVLHRRKEGDTRPMEDEANAFASEFLMPRIGVMAHPPRGLSTPDLIRSKTYWGVSVVAMAYRLHHLGLITQWHYKHLCIEFSRQGFRTNEPHPMARETSQVLKKVFQRLRSKGIGKTEVARQMALFPRDVDELVFGLVISAVD